jgi:hypothetical protein
MLTNKYSAIYDKIIQRSKDRTLSEYTEKHHILPSSLGGSNDRSNIAVLTAREHFICHLLLTKMTEGEHQTKMGFALHKMLFARKLEGRKYTANRSYALRAHLAAIKNRVISPELKKLRSDTLKKTWIEKREQLVSASKIYANSIEGKAAKKKAGSGKSEAKSIASKARRWSEETKKKMSDSRKRKFAEDPAYKAKILSNLRQFVSL